MEDSVECTFHHVPSNVVELISSSIGIHPEYNKNKNQIYFTCLQSKADQIRSKLVNFIDQYPQIWFSITTQNKSKRTFLQFGKNIANEIHVSFGSLFSTSKFFVHDTPLNNRNQWTIIFRDEQTLLIKCSTDNIFNSSICLTLPMKYVDKRILVIENNTYSDIILNTNVMTIDEQVNGTINSSGLFGDNPIIESLNRCSDILIRISSKSDANQFIDYLRFNHQCEIFYTIITIEDYIFKSWDKIEFNWYPMPDALYAILMLHSLGYLFDDKYLRNEQLQSTMVDLAEEDEKRFYRLALRGFNELKRNHWIDLTTIFNQQEFDGIYIESDNKFYHIGVIHLTPTRCYIMPKEQNKGHRVLRHKSFQDKDNFLFVYLKPDPPNEYINANADTLNYFQKILESGIEFGRNRYHLFGSSNSQLKEHSFWFIKSLSLDDIAQKRLQLGQLDGINNLGTYVSRLGLWFSTSTPTDIKLIYCNNREEFDKYVKQGKICVMCINDIERNNYCFTDGNGFISKGLAKSVAEKLSLYSQNNFPSAYQIRLAGCKGVLIVDPQSTFEQFYIKIRPSMKKFECNDWTLDICEYSQPTSTRLNNQIILLMSDLGVPNETFLRLQKQWFKKNPSRTIYSDALLKNKIPLPVNECRYMYGCAFETKLQPGTCFIRYQILNDNGKPFPNPQFKCVQGPVIVTKNPCPYAGDMLELIAVDLPELHDLSDVIVFSVNDNRPDFNKIAGSDLDGDKYFVYWGKEFQLKSFVPPLDYTAQEKIKHLTPISPQDVIKYYLSTLGATSYGEIYNLHAVIVDRNIENHPQRTCQNLSIQLARMFASAIDSGKTGYIINKEDIRQIREKYGEKYPDFLMKYGKNYYKSESIVGILYRNALLYKKSQIDQLNNAFARLNISDSRLEVSTPTSLNSLPLNSETQLCNANKNHTGYKSMNQPKSTKK